MVFHYVTGLGLNMGYLSIPLDEPSKVILTIIMSFGLFNCQVLPQGAKPAVNIFQVQMSSPFIHLKINAPKIYPDDVLHTSRNSFDRHLKYLEQRGRYASICRGFLAFWSLEVVTNH